MLSYFVFCKTDGDKKSQELQLNYLYSTCMTKHPSRKVINFRHLLSCHTIVTAAQLGTIDVFSEDTVGQILEVSDKRFKRDQLALKKKASKTFIRLKREDEEDIDQYIDKFEECYADLMKVGRDLDDETLALQLMESAGLRDELSQLVITGIDEEKYDIFDQTKRAMRKYLGSERAGISAKGGIKIKEEVFESVNEEALYARNNFYRPIGGRGNMRGGFRGGKSFQRARGTAGRVQVRSYGKITTRGNLASNTSSNTIEKEVIDKEIERKVVKRQVNPVDEHGNPQHFIFVNQSFILLGEVELVALSPMKIYKACIKMPISVT